MLYPQMNQSRAVLDLNGLWKFRLLEDEADFKPGMVLTEGFEWIAVPASYNDQKEYREYRRFTGFSLYQREFEVPNCYKNERKVLNLRHTVEGSAPSSIMAATQERTTSVSASKKERDSSNRATYSLKARRSLLRGGSVWCRPV